MKKFLSILLSIILMCSVVLSVSISSSAYSWRSSVTWEDELDDNFILSKDELYYYRTIAENKAEFSMINPIGGTSSYIVDGVFNIPSEIDGYTVTSIGRYALSVYEDIFLPRKVIIPETVTRISDYAFSSNCETEYDYNKRNDDYMYNSMLESIVIPSSVVYIGNGAFAGCERLKSIELSENLVYVGEGAFYNCESLKKVVIPGNVQYVNDYTFEKCFNLEEVVVKKGVVGISSKAFDCCNSLKKITVPDNLMSFATENLGYYTEYKKVKKNTDLKIYVKEITGKFYDSYDVLAYANKNKFRGYYVMDSTSQKVLSCRDSGANVYLKISGKIAKSWHSSSSEVAKVASNGKFTSLTKGTTTITATLKDGTKYSRKFTVSDNPSLSDKTLNIKKGQTKKVIIHGKADSVNNVYKSTKKAKIIGSVNKDYFKVQGLKKGESTLKVTVNGKVLKLKVKVK